MLCSYSQKVTTGFIKKIMLKENKVIIIERSKNKSINNKI